MFPWKTSVQADIVRIREYRNKIQHMADTKTWLSEIKFKELWNDMSAVLLNLGRAFGIPNVYFEIDKALNDPLDPKREDELMKGVSAVINQQANHDEKFKKMKENIDNTLRIVTKDAEESVKHMDECKRKKKEIKKDLKGIKETVNENRTIQIEVQKDVKSLYTKIDKQTTEDNNLIECSVREMFMRQKSISDEVYVKTKAYDFASRCLSKNRIVVLRGNHGEGKTTMALKLILEHSFKRYSILKTPDDWRLVRSCSCDVIFIDDIFGVAVVSEDELKRWQNYFGEIQQAIKKGDLYVVMTVKHYILLEAKKRLMLKYRGLFDDKNIVAVMSTDMSKEENIGILSNHLKANGREIDQKTLTVCLNNFEECSTKMFPIGFPQCANLFCKIQKCYDQGDTFFQKPIHFAKECLEDVFNKKTTYDAFFLLWAEPKQSLQTKDLEEGKQDSLETLDFHKAGFIDYHEGTETYQFSHNVIADVVGLIVCERNLKDGIDFCSDDFLMMYLTTTKSADTSTTEKIFIKESRYSHLCKRLMQLSRLNKNVLLHDAFENDKILAELDKDKEQTIEIFHAACEKGFSNLVKRLLQRGVDVKKHDNKGRCPIHLAAFFGHSQVVKQLLDHDRSQLELKLDSEESEEKYKGASLMHIAVLRNYDNLLTELLNFGADLTTNDSAGKTPLLLSIETCPNMKISNILLARRGNQIEMSDNNGATPLSTAIRKKKIDLVKKTLQSCPGHKLQKSRGSNYA